MAAIDKSGLYEIDVDGEYVTPLVDNKECAYVIFDEKGIAKCGIEKAFQEKKINFRKPVSCHLYPIRISKLANGLDALNYSHWQICQPACDCGSKLDVKVYRFLKDALVRKYGQEWYVAIRRG